MESPASSSPSSPSVARSTAYRSSLSPLRMNSPRSVSSSTIRIRMVCSMSHGLDSEDIPRGVRSPHSPILIAYTPSRCHGFQVAREPHLSSHQHRNAPHDQGDHPEKDQREVNSKDHRT